MKTLHKTYPNENIRVGFQCETTAAYNPTTSAAESNNI